MKYSFRQNRAPVAVPASLAAACRVSSFCALDGRGRSVP